MPLLPRRPVAALYVPARGLLEARVPWGRDRALDHVVERERHLVPFLLTKDALLTAAPPPHAVPLHALPSSIPFPFRPLRFLRLYGSAFALSDHPVAVSPTHRLSALHLDEAQAADATRADAADRLLRLLMLAPARALPLHLLARLRLDLGLPADFTRSLLPHYPDYFALSADGRLLELVCYRKDLAVSDVQSYAQRTGGYKVGDPIAFHLSFPRGFELHKNVRKWLDDWQKLPYISPYEDGTHLGPRSDITEKRTVAVLHEALSLTIGKKMEKEVLVKLGEALRLPPGFRKVLAKHPGIFYLSHKLRTQTVVLREAYRRHMLVVKHPMMGIRYQYLHLMHMGKEEAGKSKGKERKTVRGEQMMGDEYGADEDNGEEEYDDEEDEEDEGDDIEAGAASENEDSDDEDTENVGNSAEG
ncbi:protein WHAT'S THIS FACTOR 9, mitochondrial [Lolium perenne]|uniref:protein WHAT'S THIS FACTOR 9, mitochondrial n=1 Tax=Lolium perenne TaxID=4522 RepID=UPI0021EA7B10|nr:protein WHAT'S THIS FACTOR 9, mitochondrial-like [Lolium perenne]